VEKIAAGEVVERPASVLKELVENSIDAGASRIDVAVEGAGFSMMKVSDNGCGMSRGDLSICVAAHATSKIRSADDLFSIATMGFRGEALASVAAVSRMSVASSDGDSDGLGYEIAVEGGVRGEIRPVPRTRGTTVTARDLFYNVPARKKFMKTPRGEQIAIVRIIEQIAVPFPGIRFTLTIDGKKSLDFPVAGTLRERLCAVAGNEFARELVECADDGDGISALAFVSSPDKLQPKPRFQSLYVNLRRIDNDSVAHAVRQAFSEYLGHGNRPSFFCFLDVDPSRADVNVHPTKQQMKFDDERAVFGFIYHTVRDGLRKAEDEKNAAAPDSGGSGDSGWNGEILNRYDVRDHRAVPPSGDGYGAGSGNIGPNLYLYGGGGRQSGPSSPAPPLDNNAAARDAAQMVLSFPSAPSGPEAAPGQRPVPGQAWDLIQCYQIHGLFVLAPIKNGILLIDQHAAHERVLYEQALADLDAGSPVSQQLLFPIVFEMGAAEKAVLESGKDYFNKMGFEISDFGGNAVSVSALPVFLKDGRAEEAVRGMVRYLLDGRDPESFKEPHKRFAAAFACGAAIKSGQKLSQEEMNALINTLFSANNPYTCPHGRPTLVRISVDELARRFLRT
jgi:DNA mismatch repair protein MutL